MNNFELSSRKVADCWFMSANKIIKYEKSTQNGDEILIYGREIQDKEIFFENPFNSKYVDIYISDSKEQNLIICTPNDVKCKLFRLPYGKEMFVFQPLLHTI